MSRHAAKSCQDNIFNHSQQGVEDFKAGQVTVDLVLLFETIISVSGLVGGFGDKLARTTIAHAVHDKLTAYPQTHDFLHGNKVAYGVLVQLAYEEDWDEIDKLNDFYQDLNLPRTTKELNLDFSAADFNNFSHKVANDKFLIDSGYGCQEDQLQVALKKLENHFE